MKVYAARAPFGELALSGRCKWVAPLVGLTHCAGVGPRWRKSDSGRSGRQASPRQADLRSQLPVATDSGSGCTPTTQAALFPGAGPGCPAPVSPLLEIEPRLPSWEGALLVEVWRPGQYLSVCWSPHCSDFIAPHGPHPVLQPCCPPGPAGAPCPGPPPGSPPSLPVFP